MAAGSCAAGWRPVMRLRARPRPATAPAAANRPRPAASSASRPSRLPPQARRPGVAARRQSRRRRPRRRHAASTAKPAPAATGTLIVRSTPSGAGVTINGRWRGRTPLTLDELPFRRYDVRVVQPGFEAATGIRRPDERHAAAIARRCVCSGRPSRPRRRASAAPGAGRSTASVRRSSPDRSTSTRGRAARASSSTASAVGVTPLRVPDVRIGTHVVRLELPDHRTGRRPRRVTAGQEQRVTGSLERIQ